MVAAASFVISIVGLACIAIIKRASTNRSNRPTTHTGKKPVGRFIIDGCNGPIQIKIRRNEKCGGRCNVQLLFALHPEPAEKPVDLLSKLQDMCMSAVVVFDGRSQPWPFDVSERSVEWQLPPSSTTTTTKSSSASSPQHVGSVSVLVTCRKEEADHVIVRMVKNGRDGTSCYPTNHDDGDHDVELLPILKLVRSEQGPGRQKRFLRPLGLLQSHSVACLFPHDNWSPKLNVQAQQILRQLGQPTYQSLFMPVTAEEWQASSVVSIVVTDDVYLRQRVPHCMTFQQLHDFLVDETQEPHHQQRISEEAKNR
jgi:hypothetical protein